MKALRSASTVRAFAVSAFAVSLLAAPAPALAQSARTAIIGADVLTMDAGAQYLRNQTVLVDGGVITAIGAALDIPSDARRIDARGLVLLPALMDMHVHLEGAPETWMGAFLAHGVTTVLNLRGGPEHLALRERIRRGELLAPRVFTSGPYVNRPGIETPADAARAAREQKAAGYDVIKIHGPLGDVAYRTLMDTARALGIPVVGHAPRNLPFDAVIENRQDMVAHAEELIYTKFGALDTAQLGAIPARMAAARVWLTPTMSTFHGIAAQWARSAAVDSALALADASVLGPGLRQYWTAGNPYTSRPADGVPRIRDSYAFHAPLIRALHAAGVRLLAGTDTPVPVMIPGASIHLELGELRSAGLAAYDVLAAATRNPGDFLAERVHTSFKAGRVAVGYTADLLLVRGDPLANLDVLARPVAVFVRGQHVDSARLAELRTNGR